MPRPLAERVQKHLQTPLSPDVEVVNARPCRLHAGYRIAMPRKRMPLGSPRNAVIPKNSFTLPKRSRRASKLPETPNSGDGNGELPRAESFPTWLNHREANKHAYSGHKMFYSPLHPHFSSQMGDRTKDDHLAPTKNTV